MAGRDRLDFDTVTVGDVLPPFTRAVTQETFWRYAVASFDYNPVHCDPDWVATARPFGLPVTVAHGMMTMSFMMSVVSRWAFPAGLHVRNMSSKFLRPVPAGWTIEASGTVSEKHPIAPGRNFVVVDLAAHNQDGDRVAVGRADVVFPD